MSHNLWWNRTPVAGGGLTPSGRGPAPSLAMTPYLLYETRHDGNGANPDGTKITASGTEVSSWTDDGSVGANATQGVAGRRPDWTPGAFSNGDVGGVDFSVGGATNCDLIYGTAQTAGFNDRQWYMAWAMKYTGVGSMWLNRQGSTDGMALEGSDLKVEVNNNGFTNSIGDGTSGLGWTELGLGEPFIVIVRCSPNVSANVGDYFLYMGDKNTTGGSLEDVTLGTPYTDTDPFDHIALGTNQSTDRTNFVLGAFLYVEGLAPTTNSVTPPSKDDEHVQDIFQYMKYHYLDY